MTYTYGEQCEINHAYELLWEEMRQNIKGALLFRKYKHNDCWGEDDNKIYSHLQDKIQMNVLKIRELINRMEGFNAKLEK